MAYNAKNMKDTTIDSEACKLLKRPKVAARYEELMNKLRESATQENVASATEVLKELTNIGMGTKGYPSYDMFGNKYEKQPNIKERLKALELLGKYHALFVDRQEANVLLERVTIVDDIDDTD